MSNYTFIDEKELLKQYFINNSKCEHWFNLCYNKICISLDSIEKIEFSNNHLIVVEKKREN